MEPCLSFEMYRNKQTKQLELQSRMRKCKHIYHYLQHPVFGFMNVRLQTWFPFAFRSVSTAASGWQTRWTQPQ